MITRTDHDLNAALEDMPDGWGKPRKGVLHPSGIVGHPRCPRFLMYRTRLGWVPATKRSEALTIGHLWHKLLGGMYAGLELDEVVEAVAEVVAQKLSAMTKPGDQRDLVKAWNASRAMAHHWRQTYGHPRDQNIRVVAAEQTIQKSLAEVGIPATIVGTIDLATQDKRNRVWVTDHKTCAELTTLRARGVSFETQLRCYRYLWDSVPEYREKKLSPCYGCKYNIAQKPTIRLKKKETYDDYFRRVNEWYEVQMLDHPKSPPVLQASVRWLEPPLEANDELLEILSAAASWSNKEVSRHVFYRNRSACTLYQKPCPFMCFCESNVRLWKTYLLEGTPDGVHFKKQKEPKQ